MANVKTDEEKTLLKFKKDRIKNLRNMYADESSRRRLQNKNAGESAINYLNAAAVRNALKMAISNPANVVIASKNLYILNPIYAGIINYLSNMFSWKYKVVPHKLYNKSKAKARKELKTEDYNQMYHLMLEVVDGLCIETKFPQILNRLFSEGSVYISTICDEEAIAIDTIILPNKYCRKVADTEFGTGIIQFNYSYFDDISFRTETEKKEFIKTQFSKEFMSGYNKYLQDKNNNKWQNLDPRFSTCLMMNEYGIPTLFYAYGGILDYEKYRDNELERNGNLLKYLIIHTMPHYEDKLIFDVDEVGEIHKSIRNIVEVGENAKLITTYGDVHVDKISDEGVSANEVLTNAYKSIFNNAGFNSTLFIGDSVESIKMSLIRDKGMVWKYVLSLISFYNIAVNNWYDFGDYQADIDLLPISPYTYNEDVEVFKTNATLGVGKLDYFIAAGIKQKDLSDQLKLESFLKLDEITPMQTSYTQTANDRLANSGANSSSKNDAKNDNKDNNDGNDE